MYALRSQLVLASAALAAAMMLGGAQAQAGYVSIAVSAEQDDLGGLTQPAVLPLPECDRLAGDDTTSERYGTDDSDGPTLPLFLFLEFSRAVHTLATGGAGSSSSSGSGNGPSSPRVCDAPLLQVPSQESTRFFPPQSVRLHPFFVPSFLFRPPRVA